MVYLIAILLIIAGVLVFDFRLFSTTYRISKLHSFYYFVVCCYLIFISAFQYRIGADMPAYMGEYEQYSMNLSWDYLNGFSSRLPGWVLLNVICNWMSSDFLCLKIITALFVNIILFKYFKTNTKYWFTCLFVYVISFYLTLNFNVLRASISIAIFIYALNFLHQKKIGKYYIFSFGALMFHESALLMLFLPLTSLFNITNKNINRVFIFTLIFSLIIFLLPNLSVFFAKVVSLVGITGISERAETYIGGDMYTDFHFSIFGLLQNTLYLIVYLTVLKIIVRIGDKDKYTIGMYYFFILLTILNGSFPILYRFGSFIQPIYAVLAADAIMIIVNKLSLKPIVFGLIAIVLSVMHLNALFIVSSYGELPIIQYYPYSSVFDPQEYWLREMMWGYKEGRELY